MRNTTSKKFEEFCREAFKYTGKTKVIWLVPKREGLRAIRDWAQTLPKAG
jgi:hypothetical protein